MKNLMWNRLLQTVDGRQIQNDVQRCTGNTLELSGSSGSFSPFFSSSENWTLKCAVLMGLLAKNTVITDINLLRQDARKTLTIMS